MLCIHSVVLRSQLTRYGSKHRVLFSFALQSSFKLSVRARVLKFEIEASP